MVKTTLPDNWQSRNEEVLEVRPSITGSLLVQRFESDTGWTIEVHDTSPVEEDDGPRFQISLTDDEDGLIHGHTADSVQELRGAVSAIAYMANHQGARVERDSVDELIRAMEETEQ